MVYSLADDHDYRYTGYRITGSKVIRGITHMINYVELNITNLMENKDTVQAIY